MCAKLILEAEVAIAIGGTSSVSLSKYLLVLFLFQYHLFAILSITQFQKLNCTIFNLVTQSDVRFYSVWSGMLIIISAYHINIEIIIFIFYYTGMDKNTGCS